MKRRPRPVGHALNKAMLAWIPVDIVRTMLEIVFVADRMFPESWLPDTVFSTQALRLGDIGFRQSDGEPLVAEFSLDLLHSQRVSLITARQSHHQVPVIRKQHRGYKSKRMTPADRFDCRAKKFPSRIGRQNRPTVVSHHREEERPAWNIPPSIIRHGSLRTKEDAST